MMFTQEQINEIEQRLALKGTKDSQLPKAELPLKGNETTAIIQDGINKNLPVKVLFKSPIEGTFNVSKYLQLINEEETLVKVSLEEAVTSVPTMAKNEGQTIVFIDSNNTWQCYQYQGDTIDDWEDLLKWKNLNDSSPAPIEEGAQIYNISEYLPGGAKYGQLIGAGVYTIYGDVTPVSQYRTIFGWDPDLGEVLNPEEKDTSLVIKEIDTDGVSAYEYYVFVGNDSDGYGYQATLLSTEEDIPEWIDKAFGNTNDSILVNINKLKEEINRTKISKGGLKTIQGKSIEGVGNIEISTYINQFASSNNPINWNWGGDGNIGTVDIDNVKGVKASYSKEYETGNVYSVLDVTLKARQHYLFSFYLSGEGECDLALSNLWDNVYVREFSNPIIIDGDEYIEFDNWKSHLKFTSVGYHYISFYANTAGAAQIDFEFNTNNNIIFYKPLFVACNPKSTVSWFANDEDIFTTKEQFGIAFKGVAFNSTTKNIEFTCVDNTKKYLDATIFVKDGMVSSVAIVNGNLVITFNTDSGKEAISIPLTAIFNPANYYTKTDIDGKLVPATTTTLGFVKLYNTNGTNKSGLLVQEDGGLVINAPTSMTDTSGVYIDGAGQLKANIKAAATNAEIEAGTSTEKAITPSNLSKVKESFDLATVATSGSYNDLGDKPTIPTKTSDLNNDSGFVDKKDIAPKTETTVIGYGFDKNSTLFGYKDINGTIHYPQNGKISGCFSPIEFIISDDFISISGEEGYTNIGYWIRFTRGTGVQLKDGDNVIYTISQPQLYFKSLTKNTDGTFSADVSTGTSITSPVTSITFRTLTFVSNSNGNLEMGLNEHGIIKYYETTELDRLHKVAITGSYTDLENVPTFPNNLIAFENYPLIEVYSWKNDAKHTAYVSSNNIDDISKTLYISADNSFDNWYTRVSIDSNNRLQASTISGGNYNRIRGYAPYAGTLVINVYSDSQGTLSAHKWFIKNSKNNINGIKQYSVNVGITSSQTYVFYVEQGEFNLVTDNELSPNTTIVFTSIKLIPATIGLEREVSQYSSGYMSAADKTKLDGIATGATANIGTVTGVIINNVTKTPTNGTVNLGTVLTSTTSSVTSGSTTPITSGGVYSALQNYETKLAFTTSSSTSYTAQRNKYCRFTTTLSSLGISLPTSSLVAGDTCAFNFTTSSSFSSFTITGGTIKKMKDFAIGASKTYEVIALYDGAKWLVTATEFE